MKSLILKFCIKAKHFIKIANYFSRKYIYVASNILYKSLLSSNKYIKYEIVSQLQLQ